MLDSCTCKPGLGAALFSLYIHSVSSETLQAVSVICYSPGSTEQGSVCARNKSVVLELVSLGVRAGHRTEWTLLWSLPGWEQPVPMPRADPAAAGWPRAGSPCTEPSLSKNRNSAAGYCRDSRDTKAAGKWPDKFCFAGLVTSSR